MDGSGIKIKTMECTASRKSRLKWLVNDDILHYEPPQMLALIQSVTVSSELKNANLKNFHCRCRLGNKDSKYSFKEFSKFLAI